MRTQVGGRWEAVLLCAVIALIFPGGGWGNPADAGPLVVKVAEFRLKEPRQFAAAVVADEYLLVLGGLSGRTIRADYERIRLSDGSSELLPLPPPGRFQHSAVAHAGKVYVFGGLIQGEQAIYVGQRARDPADVATPHYFSFSAEVTDSVLILDPRTGATQRGTRMKKPRYGMGAAVVGGNLHLLGGSVKVGRRNYESDAHDVYNPTNHEWSAAAALLAPQACQAIELDRMILLAGGGRLGRSSKGVFAYDAESKGWRMLGPLPYPIAGHSMARHGRHLLLFGDYDDEDTIVAYDLVAQTGRRIEGRFGTMLHSTSVVVGDKVYVIDGLNRVDGRESDLVQVFAIRPESAP